MIASFGNGAAPAMPLLPALPWPEVSLPAPDAATPLPTPAKLPLGLKPVPPAPPRPPSPAAPDWTVLGVLPLLPQPVRNRSAQTKRFPIFQNLSPSRRASQQAACGLGTANERAPFGWC